MFEQLPSRAPSIQSNATRRPPSEVIDETAYDNQLINHDDSQLHGPNRKTGGESTQRWWEMSLVLKNTGSVARDHLASERTFLAWMRTSVSLAMAGVGELRVRLTVARSISILDRHLRPAFFSQPSLSYSDSPNPLVLHFNSPQMPPLTLHLPTRTLNVVYSRPSMPTIPP
jgi:hypothetical protein